MIKKSIVGIFVLMVIMFFASENSFAQYSPSPNGCIRIMGVETEGCKSSGTNKTGTVTNGQYTAAQVNNMKQWIAYFESQINQWFAYRDRTVAPYWNDPTYYRWARSEYARANQSIGILQQSKANYQNALRRTGQL